MDRESILTSRLVRKLQSVRDYRVGKGKRYPLWMMLLIAILGVMSGCQGYKALEDFGIRHYQKLCEVLELNLGRMPSDTTLRRMFHRVDFQQMTQQFNAWATEQFEPQEGEWVAVDGKSIKGTVQNSWEAFQNFVNVVSVYSHRQRLVIAHKSFENKTQIENGLHWVRDVVFQEDAAPFTHKTPALNWSVLRSITLNLFRAHGYHSLTRAMRLFSHDLLLLLSLLISHSPSSPPNMR